jgi:hypothetical protein
VNVSHVRDLRGVIEREKATQGVLLCLEDPTRQMLAEVAAAGVAHTAWGDMPRLQIETVGALLESRSRLRLPPARQLGTTFKKAPRVAARKPQQQRLLEELEAAALPPRAGKMAKARIKSPRAPRRRRTG